jgi:MoxR-like ATPase
MLAVMLRVRSGIPVILMGECGCGKTMLFKYLTAWMKVPLLVLDCHGGTQARAVRMRQMVYDGLL